MATYLEQVEVLLLEGGEDAVVPHHLHLEEHGALAQHRLRGLREAGEGLGYPGKTIIGYPLPFSKVYGKFFTNLNPWKRYCNINDFYLQLQFLS